MTWLRSAPWRHPATWLLLIFAIAVAAGIDFVLKLKGYYVMPDELTYQREAIGIADRLRPLASGDAYYNSPGQLAPVLHAFVWGLVDPVGRALDASHVLNVVVFASSCLPVFLLVRRITASVPAALMAGAATVAVPWLAMSGTMMTEAVAYTAFCWAVLAVHRAVAQPGPKGDVIGLLGVALAVVGRSQLAVLAGTLVGAILVRESIAARAEGLRPVVARHLVLLGVGAVVLLYLVVTGSSPRGALGNYGIAAQGDLLPSGTFAYARELLLSVGVACGVLTLPLAAGWAAAALGRPRNEQAFAAALVVLLTAALLVLAVAAFSVRFTAGQNDRYIAYLAPLLFTGTAAVFTIGPLGVLPMTIAAAGSVWLYWTGTLTLLGPSLVAPGSAFRTVLSGRSQELAGQLGFANADPTAVIAVALALVLALILIATRRLSLPLVGAVVGAGIVAYGVAETAYTLRKVAPQAPISQEFIASRGWADRALPEGQPLNAFVGVTGDPSITVPVWWDMVFYNRRVRRVYGLPDEPAYDQPAPLAVDLDPRTGELRGLPGGYLLVPTEPVHVGVRGAHAVASLGPVSLVRVPARPHAAFSFGTNLGSGQMNIGTAMPLRIFGDGRARQRRLTLTAAGRGGPVRVAVHDDRGRRLMARTLPADAPVSVAVRVRVAAVGVTRLLVRLEAPRRGAVDGAFLQTVGIRLAG